MPTVKNRWRHLAILATALSLDNSETSVLTSLFPAIRASLELSLTSLGVLTSSSKIAGALTGPLWIWLARRWSRKAVLVICSGAWGVWGIAAGFSNSFAVLLACYSIFAMGTAGAQSLVMEFVSDLFEDAKRGRAVGYVFGALSLVGSIVSPALGQLSGIENGWRIGFWLIGSANIVAGLLVLICFRDPGVGATEVYRTRLSKSTAGFTKASALSIFRVPTFNLMLLTRALSGQLLILTFGVVYLTQVYGFQNRVAAVVLAPVGIGYFIGTVGGATLFDRMHKTWPHNGRVFFLQTAQILVGVLAYFATQFDFGSIAVFCVFWFLLGISVGAIPAANRPIVMSVIRPELRGWAFVVLIAIVESVTWAIYNVCAGWLGDRYGLKIVFLVAVVGLSLANGLVMTLLYRTYARDAVRMQDQLAQEATG